MPKMSALQLPGSGSGELSQAPWATVSGPCPPPAAALWGNICPHVVTLPTPRDSTGRGRQDVLQQQELPEEDSAGHTRSQQPSQDGNLLPVRCSSDH